MLLYTFFLSSLIIGHTNNVNAQNQTITVSGIVKDKTGEIIIGATVVVEGTTKGTITDINGGYSLTNIPADGTLNFSFIGFKTQKIAIEGKPKINVTLQDESIGINEVVAIGYGTVKKGDLTGAVAKVDAKSLEERPLTKVDQALAGAMAGVTVRSTSGTPGADMQIRVRGGASVSASNDPLYVVDGMVVDDLNGLNPNDIESMQVLKDASSSAIYGSRGSNGVVIIKTKSGKKGKPKFNFSAYFGLQQIEKKLDLLSAEEWEDVATEYINKSWTDKCSSKDWDSDETATNQERAALLDYDTDANNYDSTDLDDYYTTFSGKTTYLTDPRWTDGKDDLAYIDWQDEFYRIAPMQNYALSVSGGSEKTVYNISGAWFNQEGIAVGTGFKRVNLSSKLHSELSKRISVDLKISPSLSWSEGPSIEGKGGVSNKVLQMSPVAEKDAGIYTSSGYNRRYVWAGSANSPIAIMEQTTATTKKMIMNSNLGLNFNIMKGLDFKVTGGWYYQGYDNKNYTPTFNLVDYDEGESSSGYKKTQRYNNYQLETLLNYSTTFNGDHDFSAMLGWSTEDNNYDMDYLYLKGFPNDQITTINYSSATSVRYAYTSESYSRMLSTFARIIYSYKSKYLFNGSLRRDGSSRFAEGNRYGIFPAFSAGWRISSEDFMAGISDVVNNLKVRVSWGQNGNNHIGDYETDGAMSTINYSFNGSSVSGYYPSSYTNTELGWEKTASTDIGVDLGLWSNRITFAADYYYKKTTDLLFDEPVPSVTGYSESTQNVGSVENHGLELELSSHILTGALKWNLTGNIGFNANKVLKLGKDENYLLSGVSYSGQHTNIIQLNKSLNCFYLYEAIGVLSEADIAANEDDNTENNVAVMDGEEAGDIKYKDMNDDDVIDEDDIHIVGKPTPDYTWGLTNNFSYKNFDLSIFFQGQAGCKNFAAIGRAIDVPGGISSNHLGRWRNRYIDEEHPGDGHTPKIDGTTGTTLDTRWLYDATYTRLKNVTLAYNLPKDIVKGVSSLRLYVSLENLWRKDSYYGGFSPESANASSSCGVDYGAYPEAKTYTLGLNLSF